MEEKKEKFLEEHLYGKWRFLEVVRGDILSDYTLSKNGQEELKEMVILEYQKEWVKHPLKKGQNSFSDPRDMWIFALEGGISWGKLPTYTVEKVKKNLFYVTYSFPSLQGGSKYLILDREDFPFEGKNFWNDIYIDPDDTESIYVKFGVFWKLTRIVEESGN